jgi:hypothetical protein
MEFLYYVCTIVFLVVMNHFIQESFRKVNTKLDKLISSASSSEPEDKTP